MMPFDGGIASTENGTLVLALAAAIVHFFAASQGPSMRRTFAAAAPAALLCALCVTLAGPPYLSIGLAIAAAGEALAAQENERLRFATITAHVAASMVFAWMITAPLLVVLGGHASSGGALMTKLMWAGFGVIAFVVGVALPFLARLSGETLLPAVAPAMRHLGTIVVAAAVLG